MEVKRRDYRQLWDSQVAKPVTLNLQRQQSESMVV